ncbi:MAG: histidine--tRNA ligase, partial [Alphaproteobacteria bacterium]|nr:histidine--tRNA ligase [Alphaproteobacteria bacterium]
MDLKPTKPLSGFIELLPAQQRCFDYCAAKMQNVLRNSGYSRLDLPAIERAEVLTDKDNWDEIETQIFLFQKGDTKMGLRYDGTVGLSRFVAGHLTDLNFPFYTYQFARNYRGERPQRGRYREFWQLDIDILGIQNLSLNYDAEIVATLMKMYESIADIVGGVRAKIGNRRFWNAMFSYLNLNADQARDAFVVIDKRDKIADFYEGLVETVGENAAKEIDAVFKKGYRSFVGKTDELDAAIAEMDKFMKLLDAMGVKNAEIDVSIMRGHSYYTGIVFEFFSIDYPDLPAVGGGGRYENLASKFSKTKIVGVGASIGVSRLLVALMEAGKIDLTRFSKPVDVAVLVMGNENLPYAMQVLNTLRDNGIPSVAYLDTDKKFKNQIEYADKIGARFAAIIGETEVANNVIALKDMVSGNQESLSVADAV